MNYLLKYITALSLGLLLIGINLAKVEAQTTCQDTAAFTQLLVAFNGERLHNVTATDTSGFGLMYPLNQQATVSGFKFYAHMNSIVNASDTVFASIYTSSNKLPNTLQGTDTLVVDTSSLAEYTAIFDTPVVVNDNFVLALETPSDSSFTIQFGESSGGGFEDSTVYKTNGRWGVYIDSTGIAHAPNFQPIIEYSIDADFFYNGKSAQMLDTTKECSKEPFNITGNSSPIMDNHYFSQSAAFGFSRHFYYVDTLDTVIYALNQSVNFTRSFDTAGTYIIALNDSFQNYLGTCRDRQELVVEVDSYTLTKADYGYWQEDTNYIVYFSDSSVAEGVTSRIWYFGDGDSTMGKNPMHIYSSTGTYQVDLVINNPCHTDTMTKFITVTCIQPTANFVAVEESDTNTVVDFNNSSSKANAYSWDFGDSNGSTNKNPTYTYGSDGQYVVTLISKNACGADTTRDTINVTCKNPTIADIGVTPKGGGEYKFTSSTSNVRDYSWDFGDGSGTSSQANPTYTFGSSGTYDVVLTVTNMCGTNKDTVTVQYVGIDEPVENTALQVYPNPTSGSFEVFLPETFDEPVEITITNLVGEIVYKKHIQDYHRNRLQMDLSEQNSGLYFIQVTSEEGTQSSKLMVE